MKEGEMWQVIDGVPTQVVRWSEEILPVNHPLVKEVIGQLVLFETIEETL